MIGRFALAFLLSLSVAPPRLPAQSLVEAGAGMYFGHPSSLNGPLLFVRHLSPVGRVGAAGVRVEFRDDDDGGGRSQAVGAALEGLIRFGTPALTVYVPASVGLEGVFTSDYFSPQYRDIQSGVYPRLAVGLGLAMGSERGQAALEVHRAFSTYGSYTAVTLGARAQRAAGRRFRSQVLLYGNTLHPFGSAYRREPDFRGYTIAFQQLAPERRVQGLRLSLGIDFLDFSYSTGLIEIDADTGERRDEAGAAAESRDRFPGLQLQHRPHRGARRCRRRSRSHPRIHDPRGPAGGPRPFRRGSRDRTAGSARAARAGGVGSAWRGLADGGRGRHDRHGAGRRARRPPVPRRGGDSSLK